MHRQSEKNLLNSNICFTCPRNMVNFGPLTAEISSGVWGTSANFNGFGSLTARHSTGWPKKIGTIFCTPLVYQILTDFENYYTIRIRKKFVIVLSLKVSPHLKYVATLPCEMSAFHWSCHWSVASPSWVCHPAARRTHWTFDVKTAWCDSFFRQ